MAANHAQTMQHLYHVAEAASEDLRAFVACFTADGGRVRQRRSQPVDITDRLGKRLRRFLRQIVPHAARD